MPKPDRTPREQLERAMHVSFKLPTEAAAMLDGYRDQVLAEAAAMLAARHNEFYDAAGGGVAAGITVAADLLLAARTGQED